MKFDEEWAACLKKVLLVNTAVFPTKAMMLLLGILSSSLPIFFLYFMNEAELFKHLPSQFPLFVLFFCC